MIPLALGLFLAASPIAAVVAVRWLRRFRLLRSLGRIIDRQTDFMGA